MPPPGYFDEEAAAVKKEEEAQAVKLEPGAIKIYQPVANAHAKDGTAVRIICGPYAGHDGTVTGRPHNGWLHVTLADGGGVVSARRMQLEIKAKEKVEEKEEVVKEVAELLVDDGSYAKQPVCTTTLTPPSSPRKRKQFTTTETEGAPNNKLVRRVNSDSNPPEQKKEVLPSSASLLHGIATPRKHDGSRIGTSYQAVLPELHQSSVKPPPALPPLCICGTPAVWLRDRWWCANGVGADGCGYEALPPPPEHYSTPLCHSCAMPLSWQRSGWWLCCNNTKGEGGCDAMPIKAVKPIRDEPELIDTRAIEAEMAKHTASLLTAVANGPVGEYTFVSSRSDCGRGLFAREVIDQHPPLTTHHSPLTTPFLQALPDLVLCEYGGPRLCDKNRSRFLKGDYALQIPTTSTFIDGTYYCYPGLYAQYALSCALQCPTLSDRNRCLCAHCFVVLRAAPPLHCNASLTAAVCCVLLCGACCCVLRVCCLRQATTRTHRSTTARATSPSTPTTRPNRTPSSRASRSVSRVL